MAQQQQQQQQQQTDFIGSFKVILDGIQRVGKTTLMHFFRYGEFDCLYNLTTQRIRDHSLVFYTNSGPIQFRVHDIGSPGRRSYYSNYRNLTELHECQGAILMFDLTSRLSFKAVHSQRLRDIKSTFGDDFPIVYVGNKTDESEERAVRQKYIDRHVEKHNAPYHEMSVNKNYQVLLPFQTLARHFLQDPDLCFRCDPDHAQLVIDALQNVKIVLLPMDVQQRIVAFVRPVFPVTARSG
uniref:Uncharacterized protein n=1 Tax=Amphora coffeiformis TaxID=265554 RepID=A0A7S3L3T5_9STRA